MLSGLSIFGRKKPFRPRRIILLGPEGSGKTTLSYRLMNLEAFPVAIPPGMFCVTQHAWWKGQAYQLVDVGGDGLSFRTLPRLQKHYYNADCMVLFLIDSTKPDLKDAARVLEAHLPYMIAQGTRYLWIVPNKQDLLTNEAAAFVGEALRYEVNRVLEPYSGKIMTSIADSGRFSGLTGVGIGDIFDEIPVFLDNHSTFVPISGIQKNETKDPGLPGTSEKLDVLSELDSKRQEMKAEEFYDLVKSKVITLNTSSTQLRMAYLVLLECMSNGQGLFEASEILRSNGWISTEVCSKPHRTIEIIYLYHLQASINQVTNFRSGHPPEADEFDAIKESWSNMMRHAAWKDYLRTYYSENLVKNTVSENHWRLPDLRDLPHVDDSHYKHFPRSFTRLPRFAFAVVKMYMTMSLPRTWVVNQALSIFQQATFRLRREHADNVDMYSETQIYFWITYIHLLVSHFNTKDIPSLQFQELFSTSSFDVYAWTKHYSAKRWSSIEARMQFLQPDRKPLVPVCIGPSVAPISPALRGEVRNTGLVPELASDEELTLALAVALKLVEGVVSVDELHLNVHAHALLWLFHAFVTSRDVQLHTQEFDSVKRQMNERAGLNEDYVNGIASNVCELLREEPEKWTIWPKQLETRNEMFRGFLMEHKQLLQESLWKARLMENESLIEDESTKADSKDEEKELELSYSEVSEFTKGNKLDDDDDDEENDYDDAASTTWEVL